MAEQAYYSLAKVEGWKAKEGKIDQSPARGAIHQNEPARRREDPFSLSLSLSPRSEGRKGQQQQQQQQQPVCIYVRV